MGKLSGAAKTLPMPRTLPPKMVERPKAAREVRDKGEKSSVFQGVAVICNCRMVVKFMKIDFPLKGQTDTETGQLNASPGNAGKTPFSDVLTRNVPDDFNRSIRVCFFYFILSFSFLPFLIAYVSVTHACCQPLMAGERLGDWLIFFRVDVVSSYGLCFLILK